MATQMDVACTVGIALLTGYDLVEDAILQNQWRARLFSLAVAGVFVVFKLAVIGKGGLGDFEMTAR